NRALALGCHQDHRQALAAQGRGQRMGGWTGEALDRAEAGWGDVEHQHCGTELGWLAAGAGTVQEAAVVVAPGEKIPGLDQLRGDQRQDGAGGGDAGAVEAAAGALSRTGFGRRQTKTEQPALGSGEPGQRRCLVEQAQRQAGIGGDGGGP
ncbi:MAG: hypothetical protein GY856_30785, partial [bacterium]|nr:hypothetical protein [bacterium]